MQQRLKLQQQQALMQQALLQQQQMYHPGMLAAAMSQVSLSLQFFFSLCLVFQLTLHFISLSNLCIGRQLHLPCCSVAVEEGNRACGLQENI